MTSLKYDYKSISIFPQAELLLQISTLILTLGCIKASKAGVPLYVWVVRVERKGEAATRGREKRRIYSGLKLLKFLCATQNGN